MPRYMPRDASRRGVATEAFKQEGQEGSFLPPGHLGNIVAGLIEVRILTSLSSPSGHPVHLMQYRAQFKMAAPPMQRGKLNIPYLM